MVIVAPLRRRIVKTLGRGVFAYRGRILACARCFFFFFLKLLIYNARNVRQKQIQSRLSISLESPWALGAPTVLYNTRVTLSVSAICLQQWAGGNKKKMKGTKK